MEVDPKAFLRFGLQHFGIKILSEEGAMFYLEHHYAVEIEKNGLFKLTQDKQVVAPFSDVEELCVFIKKDIELNEKN